MTDHYAQIMRDNLARLYSQLPEDLPQNLPGRQEGHRFIMDAFGETCLIEPHGISFEAEPCASQLGILISLYALNARSDAGRIQKK